MGEGYIQWQRLQDSPLFVDMNPSELSLAINSGWSFAKSTQNISKMIDHKVKREKRTHNMTPKCWNRCFVLIHRNGES